jgi:hypothetical protein
MIADRTYRTVAFLAARVKNRLRFAAPTGHKARRVLAHRAFRMWGQKQTVSDGCWPKSGLPLIERSRPPFIGLGVGQSTGRMLSHAPAQNIDLHIRPVQSIRVSNAENLTNSVQATSVACPNS